MKNTNIINTQKTTPKLTFTTVLVLILAMLPILLFALTRMVPPVATTTEKTTVSEAETKRISAAERRAQRAEARKAKKAEKAATTSVQYGAVPDPASFPMSPMEPMEFNGGFGPGAMGFDNGMAMGPGMGGFGGGFGPGAMGGGFGPGMGGNFGMF